MKDSLKLLVNFLVKTTELTEAKASELLQKKDEKTGEISLNENALQNILDVDAKRIKNLKTKAYDDAHAKAKKEVLSREEKRLAKLYNVKEGTKLDDIIKSVVEGAKKDGEPNEEAVKKHPLYIALESKVQKEVEAAKTDYQKKLEAIEAEKKRNEVMSAAGAFVAQTFKSLKPILPKGKEQVHESDFIERFSGYNLEKVDNDYVIVNEEGERVEDEHGKAKLLSAVVKAEAAQLYDFQVQEKKESASNSTGNDYTGTAPKDKDEYDRRILEANSMKERQQIQDAFGSKFDS